MPRVALVGALVCSAAAWSCGGSEPSPVVTEIVVSPTDPVVGVPGTVQLQALALDAYGEEVPGASVSWSSSEPAIASVSSSGLVTGHAEGSATIRAGVGDVQGTTRVTAEVTVATLTIVPVIPSIPKYDTRTFTVEAVGPAGEPIVPLNVTWSVSDARRAEVDAAGRVTGLQEGPVTLTAGFRGSLATAQITIVQPVVASVEVWQVASPGPDVRATLIPIRATEAQGAVAFDRRGNILHNRGPATWASSNEASMIVDPDGMVLAIGPGSTEITATVEGVESAPVTLTTLVMPPLVQLGVGDFRTCAVAADAAAYCWGAGVLAGETTPSGEGPVRVAGGHAWSSVSSGDFHTCGVTTAGAAYCWGSNGSGQLGDGTTTDRDLPTRVAGGQPFQSISAGGAYTCAITVAGEAYCWGDNGAGKLGTGDFTPSLVPVPVTAGLTFRTISTSKIGAGSGLTCGVTTDDEGYCWGENSDGQLGTGDSASSAVPRLVAGGHEWAEISAALFHVCGRTTTDQAYCWGANPMGAFGDGTLVSDPLATPVSGGSFASISAGYLFSCAVATISELRCFGRNEGGQIGVEGVSQSETPVSPLPGITFSTVRAGRDHACALRPTGVVYCWGGSGSGSDGDATLWTPRKVLGQP